MIKSALFKLTFAYLAIIMALSIGFSVTLYHISDTEIGRGLRRPGVGMLRETSIYNFDMFRDDRLRESRENLKQQLILLNIITAAAGFAVSYLLARKTLEPIAEAMESQNRFTADASHELRTPLTAMQTEIEVALRDKKLSIHDAREQLESNLEEVAKLRMLADGLLRLARHDGKKQLNTISSVNDAVTVAIDHNTKSANAKQIIITKDVASSLQAVVDTDSLAEIVSILLDNAIKYSDKKSKIFVSATADDTTVYIRVEDNGIGIAKDDLPHIFDRFYRADSARTSQEVGGHGLGLSIAAKIVSIFDGKIQVEQTSVDGTTFLVTLHRAFEAVDSGPVKV